jgi:Succinyl-CoA ligase like flavodoxin domain
MIGLSAIVTPGDDSDVEIADLPGYLAVDESTEVIVGEMTDLIHPRRFIARARAIARRKPVLALLPLSRSGADDRRSAAARLSSVWEQVGIETVAGLDALTRRARELPAQRQAGTWRPPVTGALVELPDCNAGRARTALDTTLAAERFPAELPRAGLSARRRLGRQPTADLLAA